MISYEKDNQILPIHTWVYHGRASDRCRDAGVTDSH